MTQQVNWGVIGPGGIARRRTIPEGITRASNARLVSVYDVSAAANQDVAKQFGAKAAGSVAELLESGIHAVYVATPAHLHYAHVLECARAGKHVLCEKPLGMSVAQAEEMIKVCRSAGVQLGCAFMMRFQTQHQAALEIIRSGKLGQPVYGRAQLSCWYPPMAGAWRQDPALGGGGSLMDMGGHCIDLLEMFFGPVVRVTCNVRNTIHNYASEDSAVAMLQFANGALATVDTFFCIQDASSQNVLELYGSKGSILARGTIGQGSAGEMIAYLSEAPAGYEAQQSRAAGGGIKIAPEPRNPYQAEIEEFSRSVLSGRCGALDAEIGLRSQKVLSACYESARKGCAIAID